MRRVLFYSALFAALFIAAMACDRKPFVEHKVKSEKLATGCGQLSANFKMISNFGGERFQFEKCLPASFENSQVTATRQGDTVLVRFPAASSNGVAYAITLDIDSYPRYNFITIDDDTYAIVPSNP